MNNGETPTLSSTENGANIGTVAAAEETTHRAASITLSDPWVREVGMDAVHTYVRSVVAAIPQITAASTHDDAEQVFRSAMGAAGVEVDDIQVARMTESIRVARGMLGFALADGTVVHDPHQVTPTQFTPPDRQETDPENDQRPTYS